MTVINIEDLKRWRERRIQAGNCNHDDMQALGAFIAEVETIDTKEVKYFDEDEKVWKIGEII